MTIRNLLWQLIGVVLTALLLGGCSAATQTLDQETLGNLLIEAVTSDDIAEVSRLLEAGADANAESKSAPVIMIAAIRGNADIVKMLAEHGADVNVQSEDGKVPIVVAAKKGNLAVVGLLLDLGVDVNSKDGTIFEHTPLYEAVDENNLEMAKLLLERGADVNLTDNVGETPLHEAAYNYGAKWVEMGQLLIDYGADINAVNHEHPRGNLTPLHNAAIQGSPEFAQLLIDEGAELNPKDAKGLTPLDRAIGQRHEEVAQVLREAGAKESQ